MHKPHFFYASAQGSDTFTMYLVGAVGDWWENNDAKSFISAIKRAKREGYKFLHLKINSEGGNVIDGLTIYNELQNSGMHITTEILGMAASMAAIIFLAGHVRIMPDNTLYMLHSVWTRSSGNAEEFRKTANDLEKFDNALKNIIRSVSGCSDKLLTEWFSKDTWFNASEALNHKLATETRQPTNAIALPQNYNNSLSKDVFRAHYQSALTLPYNNHLPNQETVSNILSKILNVFEKAGKGDEKAIEEAKKLAEEIKAQNELEPIAEEPKITQEQFKLFAKEVKTEIQNFKSKITSLETDKKALDEELARVKAERDKYAKMDAAKPFEPGANDQPGDEGKAKKNVSNASWNADARKQLGLD